MSPKAAGEQATLAVSIVVATVSGFVVRKLNRKLNRLRDIRVAFLKTRRVPCLDKSRRENSVVAAPWIRSLPS
jgi:hypothetical protein